MEDPMSYEIYRLIFPVNRSYIGQAKIHVNTKRLKGAERRWREHQCLAIKGKEGPLYDVIREYGPENFNIEVLLYCHQREADMYETTIIEAYDSMVTGNGYNQTEGGQGFTAETFRLKALPKTPWKTKGERKRPEDGDLPKNIRFHKTVWGEGYHVGGRRNGKRFGRYYMSIHETMESKLQKAKAWQEYFEREGVPPEEEPPEPPTVPAKRRRAEDSELPRGIYSVHVKRKRGLEEGYGASFHHEGKCYQKQFVSSRLTMDDKMELAQEWLEKRSKEVRSKDS
jgi:hypothetical protein